MLGQALAQLDQGQIRLRLDPEPHRGFQMGDAGDAMAAHRPTAALARFEKARLDLVHPNPAYLVTLGNRTRSFASCQCTQNPITQIL